jgi:transcriptional regulator with XRE-family HTH domain
MTFSERLKQWRKANNLLQKQAAGILGVSLSTIQHWEYGDYEPSKKPCLHCIEEKMSKPVV